MAFFDRRKGKWIARARWRNESQWLGNFETESEAVQAEEEQRQIWKEYAAWEKDHGLPG